jgi:cutinase
LFNMKVSFSLLTAALFGLAAADPLLVDFNMLLEEAEAPVKRQDGTTLNEYVEGGCRSVIIFFARGTNEPGNIGDSPGPQTISGLKAALGDAAVAGQGLDYSASLLGNLYPGGTPPAGAASAATLITQAANACPSSRLVVSGYSQGAALIHRAVERVSAAVSARIVAAVTYGDTQREQDNGVIPNLAASKSLIICHDGDMVCEGTLIITDAHFGYENDAPQAVSFIRSKL